MCDKKDARVGIGDMKIVENPYKVITIGLGSCVGISFYDRRKKIAGLAHIMLPDSSKFKNITNEMKYADLAIPMLLSKMKLLGCEKRNIEVKIAGGASMFQFSDSKIISDVGKRNVEAVRVILRSIGLAIISYDVGGNSGRTMIVNSENGIVDIKSIGLDIKHI
ncbi:MAG: chemotaxis protein CheD [Clostridium sp.]